MTTEGDVPRRLCGLQSLARLEPLTVGVDEAHQGNRNIEEPFRKAGQPIKTFLRRSIEHV